MVPEVDKLDAHKTLGNIRANIEQVRQEIIGWSFVLQDPAKHSEAMALRQLANRSSQQARQWTGKMLQELGVDTYPYPNSQDGTTQTIDKTTVPAVAGLDLPADYTTVQRIKQTRLVLSGIKHDLEDILRGCIPGSFFNQCLMLVQQHLIQTAMWLGELLAEFVVVDQQPQDEAVASGEPALPSPTEPTSTPDTTSGMPSETGTDSETELPAPASEPLITEDPEGSSSAESVDK